MFKCSIGREDLLKPLGHISGVAGNTVNNPITSNVLMEILPNDGSTIKDAKYKLRMVCTDTEIQMSTEVGLFCDDIQEGRITVNVKILLEILKKLPDGAYVNFTEGNTNDQLVLSSGKFKSNMVTIDAEYFPAIECLDNLYELKIELNELLNVMKTTQFSMAAESYRVFLKGMRFAVVGNDNMGLDIITADGHRMSLQKGRLVEPCIIPDNLDDNGFIFPKKGVDQLIAMMSAMKESADDNTIVTLKINKNSLQTTVNGISMLSILIEAKYPNITSILPNNCNRVLVVDRKLFQDTITRVSIMSNSLNKAVEMVLNNGLFTIKAKNSNHEEAKDDIDYVSYTGDNFEIAFNSDYLNNICRVISTSKMKISLSKSSNNLLIEPMADENEEQSYARYIVSRIIV